MFSLPFNIMVFMNFKHHRVFRVYKLKPSLKLSSLFSVLKPTIDLICDPDYINMKLITYIEYREKVSEDTRRTFTYAATYEDFIKMIKKCENIEHLKQYRYETM